MTTTFYFHHDKAHHESGQWSCGPTMQYRRKNHAVGVVTDKTTLKKLVIVTGGVGEERTSMTSEILSEDLWSKGKIAYCNLSTLKRRGLNRVLEFLKNFNHLEFSQKNQQSHILWVKTFAEGCHH